MNNFLGCIYLQLGKQRTGAEQGPFVWDQGHEDREFIPVSHRDPLQLSSCAFITGRTKVADVDLLSETAYFMPWKISDASFYKEKS